MYLTLWVVCVCGVCGGVCVVCKVVYLPSLSDTGLTQSGRGFRSCTYFWGFYPNNITWLTLTFTVPFFFPVLSPPWLKQSRFSFWPVLWGRGGPIGGNVGQSAGQTMKLKAHPATSLYGKIIRRLILSLTSDSAHTLVWYSSVCTAVFIISQTCTLLQQIRQRSNNKRLLEVNRRKCSLRAWAGVESRKICWERPVQIQPSTQSV